MSPQSGPGPPPTGAYCQVPRAPGPLQAALGPAAGRRMGHHLAATHLALRLAGEANWRNGELAPFCITSWATGHGLPYRRARRALGRAAGAGLCRFWLHPFTPGRVEVSRGAVLHDRGRPEERFVQLSLRALDAVVGEHHLSWLAEAVLVALLVRADDRTWAWSGTLAGLGPELGVGHRSLVRALGALEGAGLIAELVVAAGLGTSARVVAGPALVVAPAPRAPRRPERRRLAQAGAHGPAAGLARALLAHHGLGAAPSPALVAALGQALATGAASSRVLEALAARGNLGGAGDPMAVLVHRARAVGDELVEAARAEAERRAADQAARAVEAARVAEATALAEAGRAESAWLAQVLSENDLGALVARHQGAPPAPVMPPVALDAAIRTWARGALSARPDLEPAAALAAALAGGPLGPDPVPLPRARDGPTLAQRLRTR